MPKLESGGQFPQHPRADPYEQCRIRFAAGCQVRVCRPRVNRARAKPLRRRASGSFADALQAAFDRVISSAVLLEVHQTHASCVAQGRTGILDDVTQAARRVLRRQERDPGRFHAGRVLLAPVPQLHRHCNRAGTTVSAPDRSAPK